MDQPTLSQKLRQLNEVFTPAAPIITRDLFFGRLDQLSRVVDTINERGQHAILYGDRGVDKTSLANILHEALSGPVVAKVTCNRTEDFKAIWNKIFKRITIMAKTAGVGFTVQEVEKALQLNLFLPAEEKIDSTDILATLEFLRTPVLFIFDEFDSVKDSDTRIRFADTTKALSDNAPNVTVLLVGVAQSVTDLIGIHPSNERCIRQIHLPRMSAEEIALIIDNGMKTLGLTVDPFVRLDIIEFSNGFPHYAHLLSKYAVKSALSSASLDVARIHFDLSIDEALANVSESIRDLYQRATTSGHKGALYAHVVHACALVKEDEHGAFRATDLLEPMKLVTGKPYSVSSYGFHLAQLCTEERGPVLEQVGRGKMHQYRFRHPLLRAFLRIRLYQGGLIKGATSPNTSRQEAPVVA
jgi:Cdc6-like AAA superfamily ATPase